MTFELKVAIFTTILTTIGGLVSLWWQFKESRKIAKAQLLIEFDNRLSSYDKIHGALRNGSWGPNQPKPKDIEWYEVEAYMGAFERLEIFINDEIVEKSTAIALYQYRLKNIVGNEEIKKYKLQREKASWEKFLNLCRLLNVTVEID